MFLSSAFRLNNISVDLRLRVFKQTDGLVKRPKTPTAARRTLAENKTNKKKKTFRAESGCLLSPLKSFNEGREGRRQHRWRF